jgi:CDP-glycerol glycerophosphotransferase (TagB/SpsB family)
MDYFRILPRNRALFNCFPDFEDQTFSMILELTKQSIPTFLISESLTVPNHWIEENLNVKLIKRNSVRSFFYAKTSKYIFHTHGFIFSESISRKQVVIGLWHGIPLKKIGIEIGNKMPNSTFSLISSSSKAFLMERAYSKLEKKPIFINFGLPRLDLLKTMNQESKIRDGKLLWMPTYRNSIIGEIRADGFVNDLGLGMNNPELILLDKFFLDKGIYVELLLHPMSGASVPDELSAIHLSSFDRKSQSLYRFINNFDGLITDYSSIAIDFLVTKKPLYIFTPDYEIYEKSRGFFGDFEKLLGINVSKNIAGLMKELNKESYDFTRLEKALTDWHDYHQNDRAEKIWQQISEYIL